MTKADRIMLPLGYRLLTHVTISQGTVAWTSYGFARGDEVHGTEYSREIDAIDAMWADVRNRAARAARPDINERERDDLNYAMGFADGKLQTSQLCVDAMRQRGYSPHHLEPHGMISELLDLLSPPR